MFKKNQKNLIYLCILLFPFLLFFLRPQSLSAVKASIIDFTSFPLRLFSLSIQEAKKVLYYHYTFDEYKRLKNENGVLKSRLIGLEEVIRENTRLEKLLEFKRHLIYSSVVASVIGREPSHWNSSLIIDKGADDGIKQGQPVVNALGVVGKITEVNRVTSKVIFLTDPQFSVAALIQRPRESGLVSGSLQGVCRLRFLNENADIQAGDKVITSKLSSSFPEGLYIGEISQIQKDPEDLSVECIIQPAVSFSQIEEVLVIFQ